MAVILNIDTSTETAGICLAKNGAAISFMQNEDQKDHAAWLHTAIEKMINDSGYAMEDLQAVAIISGPGSYTGLRVGMSTAKGLCYALQIPLIVENSLKMMAIAAQEEALKKEASLICPMIDARRMEVFTALYTIDLKEVIAPTAIVLNKNSFEDFLVENSIFFTGNGTKKWQEIIGISPKILFGRINPPVKYLGEISNKKYEQQEFTDILYSEPIYIKEFYTHKKK